MTAANVLQFRRPRHLSEVETQDQPDASSRHSKGKHAAYTPGTSLADRLLPTVTHAPAEALMAMLSGDERVAQIVKQGNLPFEPYVEIVMTDGSSLWHNPMYRGWRVSVGATR
jgi:hypothetical protein